MRIMNPYLVETSGIHDQMLSQDTNGLLGTVLNTTKKKIKAITNLNQKDYDNLDEIPNENRLREKLAILGSYLTKDSKHPEYVHWAREHSITLRNDRSTQDWWRNLSFASRLACYEYVKSGHVTLKF